MRPRSRIGRCGRSRWNWRSGWRHSACNAALETGITSPLDEAILKARTPHLEHVSKLAEIPFDFVRKRVTVVVQTPEGIRLITKGAFHHVLEVCTRFADGTALTRPLSDRLEERYQEWSRQGIRVLAIAARPIDERAAFGRHDERDLAFMGFLTFFDRPKAGVSEALRDLAEAGVSVKIITGDSGLVAQHIAGLVGMQADRLLTGGELDDLNDEALWHAAEATDIFAEVEIGRAHV